LGNSEIYVHQLQYTTSVLTRDTIFLPVHIFNCLMPSFQRSVAILPLYKLRKNSISAVRITLPT